MLGTEKGEARASSRRVVQQASTHGKDQSIKRPNDETEEILRSCFSPTSRPILTIA